jgi:acyl transferase domain-containing protein
MDQLRGQLLALADGQTACGLVTAAPLASPSVALVYPSPGDSWAMGPEFYREERSFRHAIDRCADWVKTSLDVTLPAVLFGDRSDLLASARYAYPAHFALQYAWTETWRTWGVMPESVLGIGTGELAAACAAGILDAEAALRLLVRHGELADQRMGVNRSDAESPARNWEDELEAIAQTLELRRPTISFVSSATAAVEMDTPCVASYWRHLAGAPPRPSVSRFMSATGCNILLEVGPRDSFLRDAEDAPPSEESSRWFSALGTLGGGQRLSTRAHVAETLAGLYVAGLNLCWNRYYDDCIMTFRPMPPYTFARRAYWIAAHEGSSA